MLLGRLGNLRDLSYLELTILFPTIAQASTCGEIMFWTVLGLLIATAVSIEGAASSERRRGLKVLLIALAVAGTMIAGISAYNETGEPYSRRSRHAKSFVGG
jgi:hypothetical protein